jgi:hypothetical protein
MKSLPYGGYKIVNENYGSLPLVDTNSLKSFIKEKTHETLMKWFLT